MATSRKSVLITGCSAGGIGAGLAEVFQENGYHVFATLRNPSKVSQTLSNAANVTVLTLDVLSSESIAAAVESVKRETSGKLDVLVNNSGGGIFAPALDTPIEEGKKLFDLNFWAPMAMLQAFAPLLIKAKGCIVNNTSASSFIPMPFMSKCPILLRPFANKPGMYNGSKAALANASETWRLELQPLGVRTITLITFSVKTNFFDGDNRTEIPETSNYFEIRDFIHGLTDGRLQASGISTRQFATKVVREVEKGAVGKVWAGGDAFVARWGWWLSPQFVRVSSVSSRV
ncbi:MAG: hypothetical protein M1813_007766 [Trichoglossum hirsutum]|jgi:1-acylglycerone phosphate reductase|nr:MAG: hypothetical protein M1813_007766 [Trichoglossum hirsutum]